MHRLIPPEILSATPRKVAFWSGEGISKHPPSNGPLGEDLIERVLTCAFADGLLKRMRIPYAQLDLNRSMPRLESLLEVPVC